MAQAFYSIYLMTNEFKENKFSGEELKKVIKTAVYNSENESLTEYFNELIEEIDEKSEQEECPHLHTESTHPYGWIACKDCGKLL
jgi:benzoyl-CoA reductase/2-hydroxyglutaryl-CoA dehydratase subunit BcrC/BadD/HgdB